MTVTQPSSEHTETGGVRVCDRCGRVVPALDKKEYTPERARLIVERGLCVCPSETPAHGPSML